MILYYLIFCLVAYGETSRNKLKVTDFYVCEKSDNKLKFSNIELNNVDNDGYKDFSGIIDVPSDFTEDWQYEMRIDKFNNGDWQLDVYSRQGGFCEDMKQFFPNVWKIVTSKIDPPFSDCSGKKGRYKLDKLQINRNDYTLPGVMFGFIKTTTKLFDANNNEVFCGIMEAELE